MSLYNFSAPGWSAEAFSVAGWPPAATPMGIIQRPTTIRAELPQPRPEGQTEKR